MYTFLLSVAFFFLLSALVYGKKLRNNIFNVILIVMGGSFLATTIVNGVCSPNLKYETRLVRTINLSNNKTFNLSDSTEINNACLGYNHGYDHFYLKDYEVHPGEFTIRLLDKTDSLHKTPYALKYKDVPVVNSKWYSAWGIPRKNRHFDIWLKNDSINMIIVSRINNIKKNEN